MCVLMDLSEGVASLKGPLILWICSIAEIVLGVFFGISNEGKLGCELILDGILMIVVIFYPYQWLIIWSAFWEVLTAILFTCFSLHIIFTSSQAIFWNFIIVAGIVLILVFSIFSVVVYVKSIMRGSSGGSYSRTNTFSV